MYVLVEFPATNTVSAMPESWLINNQLCYWPLKEQTKCIRQKIPKDDRWQKCSIRLFRNASGEPRKYPSYNIANKRAIELLEISDLSSTESEETQKESRTRLKRITIPVPPKPSFFSINPLQTLLTADNLPQNPLTDNLHSHEPLQNYPVTPPSVTETETQRSQTPNLPNHESYSYLQNPEGSSKEDTTNAELLDAIKNLTQIVIKLENKIDGMENYIYNIELRRNSPEAPNENSMLPKLPMTTVEQIMVLEQFLDTPGNATILLSHLCCVGGDTIEKSTKLMLIKLFSDEGARLVIWTGANGKLRLQNMKILRIIYSATKKLHPNATEASVLGYVKVWIRRAGDRIRSKNKSTKKLTNV